MPIFHFKTNVPKERLTKELLKSLSELLSETSTKPESLCEVVAEGGVPMLFGGTEEPCAYGEYICIGVIGGEYNGKVTGKFADLAEKALGVSKNRFYIKFVDPKAADMGTHGTNCAIYYGI